MNDKIKILLIKAYAYTPNQSIDIPLGILYLSGYLNEHLNDKVETKFLDLRLAKKKKDALIGKLELFKPDVIGISMMSFEKNFIRNYSEIFKEYAPAAKIIIGGAGATVNYKDILTDNQIECAVIGEGEKVVLNLAKSYLEGRDIYNLKGIAYYNGESVVCNEREEYIEDLDSIPFPDYSVIEDIDRYWDFHLQMNIVLAEKNMCPL